MSGGGGAAAPAVEVLRPGLLTTVQDPGRSGYLHIALSRGGAVDRQALALANALVGNPPDAAGLEITGPGPTLRFASDAWIATVGARHAVTLPSDANANAVAALPTQRPVFVAAGSTLQWQPPAAGWRSWLAIAGGLDLPAILGSRSAHLAAGIGPGRLAAQQRLPLPADAARIARERAGRVLKRDPLAGRPWPSWLLPEVLPAPWPRIELPVLAGRHFDQLTTQAQASLLGQWWHVSPQSNRQGLRLQGQPLDTATLPQLASEPVAFGTVQLPPAGEPLILLVEHQSTGGYPRVLEAASAAEPLLAQAAAGCRIRFRLIELEEADGLARQNARQFDMRLAAVTAACGYATQRED